MKKKIIKRTIGILLSLTMISGTVQGLGLGVRQAYAAQIGLVADKDTFIDSVAYTDGNGGIGEDILTAAKSNWIGTSNDGWVQDSKSAIHFNLNGIDPNVTDARLQIYTTYTYPGITSLLNVYGSYNDSWPESTTTIPQQSTIIASNQQVSSNLGQWITIDVTNFINNEVNGDKQATFVLSATSGAFAFASREATNGFAPRLLVTTASNSIITPNTAYFDKNISAQVDVTTSIMSNGNSFVNITNNGVPLVPNIDYVVSGNIVTIKKAYLASRPQGTTALQFNFSSGAPQTLVITVNDTTPKYTVTFKDYNGTVIGTPQTVTYGGAATAPSNPMRAGYTFTGWDKSFNNITSNTDVNAVYSANSYTVTFRDYNGTVIGAPQVVSYGGVAIAPANPTRTGYTFTGWDKNFNNVTGNIDVNATYSIKHFLVSFVDDDGVTTIGTSQSIEYGGNAIPPMSPVKEGYTFAGWDKTFNMITGDMVVVAQYNINHYAVTFQNYDGTQIGTVQSIEYGHGATAPVATAREGYTFAGWDKSFDNITGNLIVKATYTANNYTVTFRDYNGTVIGAPKTVTYGGAATAPSNPAREGYTFTGWDKNFNNVTGNIDVIATYSIKHFLVSFVDDDGVTTIGTSQSIEYGSNAIPPMPPVKEGYTFVGWDKSFNIITGDMVVVAKYSINHCAVTFQDYDGTQIGVAQSVEYGHGAIAPEAPTREGYTFAGWDKSFDNITGNITVKATYTAKHYDVTFKNYDGTQIGTVQSVEYGHGATAPEVPAREGYTFTGWNKSYDHITGNLIVKATYTANHYDVTFQNYDGTQIGTVQSVEYGQAAIAPEAPAREGYTFIGWDRVFNNITSNVVVKAMYLVNHSTVTFVDYNGKVIGKPQTIEYGKPAISPSAPTRKGYTFIGWNKSFDSITGNLTVTAKYEINHYVVTFKDYNGAVLSAQNIEYGKDAVAPNEPTRVGYKFSAWDKAFNNISENVVVTAVYVTGITYNIPEKSVDKNTKEVKTAVGYFTSGKNTIVVNTKEAHLIIPANVVSSSDLSGVDYVKVLQRTVDSTSQNELLKKLPSDVKTVGAVLDFRIQLFNYNNALIKDIHKFANNQQVKISIKLSSEDIKNIDTSKLSVYYYDDSMQKWIELGGSFDKNTMEFNYYTSHFTKFSVMQKTKNNAETNKNNESALPKPASSEKSSSKITDAKTNLPQTGSAVDLIDLLSIGGVLILSGILLVRRKIK